MGRAAQAYSSLKRSKKQNKSHTHRPVALGVSMLAEYPSTRRGPSEYPSTRKGSSEYPSTHGGPSRVRQKQSIRKVREREEAADSAGWEPRDPAEPLDPEPLLEL